MRKLFLSSVAFAALAGHAVAADLPSVKSPEVLPPPVLSWTGFYVGVNAGYGWSLNSVTGMPYQNFAVGANGPVAPVFTYNQGINGAVAGFHGGYNYQIENLVLGAEGDFDLAGINGASARVFPDPLRGAGGLATDGFMSHENIDWLASIRGRLGYAWGRGLFYATGGVAFEGVNDKYLLSTDAADSSVYSTSTASSANRSPVGWVVGAGYEYMIAPSWTVRGEFLHYGFDQSNTQTMPTVPCSGFAASSACGANVTSRNNYINVVRLGLSYKFGDNVAANSFSDALPGNAATASWTGFYAGANGGYGWSSNSVTGTPYQNFAVGANGPVVPAFAYSQGLSGAVAGFHGGYNYQMENWVLGAEGDFDLAGINGAAARVFPDPLRGAGGLATDGFMSHENVNWLASIRGRLGYAWGRGLLYATGGVAFEGVNDKYLLSTDAADSSVYSTSTASSANRSPVGWVVGAGYEYMIAPSWTLRGEYLYYGFDASNTQTMSAVPCSGFAANSACGANVASRNNSVNLVRLGLSYKFGDNAAAPVVAKY